LGYDAELTASPTPAFIYGELQLRIFCFPAFDVCRRPGSEKLRNTVHLLVVVVVEHTLIWAMNEVWPSTTDHDGVVWRWELVVVVLRSRQQRYL